MRVRVKEIEFTYPKNFFYFSCTAVSDSQLLIYIEGCCSLIETEVRFFKNLGFWDKNREILKESGIHRSDWD